MTYIFNRRGKIRADIQISSVVVRMIRDEYHNSLKPEPS